MLPLDKLAFIEQRGPDGTLAVRAQCVLVVELHATADQQKGAFKAGVDIVHDMQIKCAQELWRHLYADIMPGLHGMSIHIQGTCHPKSPPVRAAREVWLFLNPDFKSIKYLAPKVLPQPTETPTKPNENTG